MEFNPVQHPILFQMPRFVSTISAWVEHFPFAYLLIELLRPRVLVELGTHQGDSYLAFCQTVAALKTETRCVAVDTWTGDPQAGYYDKEILQALRASHDPFYTSFSTLMQMTFDDALPKFADGEIDLLHIDGLHTYEAVKHDFDSWRPKVSDRGVVIFHDTAHRDTPHFGVHRVFDELRGQFAGFEFEHGEGLGVVLLGPNVPQPMKDFVASANANTQTVRSFFFSLGQRVRAVQVILRATEQMVQQYAAIAEWRLRTGQEQLRAISHMHVVQNPAPLAQFLATEVQRILQLNPSPR